jgi:aspartyl-tRNA(Asn)/glutamyl-tRNA(Gln) amidotransferase subunit C
MLSEEQVRHVAKLARIALSDEEIAKFAVQLSSVFDYVDILQTVDTEGVAETNQVTGLVNVMEEDEIKESQSTREELLGATELPVDSKQIRVMKVLK